MCLACESLYLVPQLLSVRLFLESLLLASFVLPLIELFNAACFVAFFSPFADDESVFVKVTEALVFDAF